MLQLELDQLQASPHLAVCLVELRFKDLCVALEVQLLQQGVPLHIRQGFNLAGHFLGRALFRLFFVVLSRYILHNVSSMDVVFWVDAGAVQRIKNHFVPVLREGRRVGDAEERTAVVEHLCTEEPPPDPILIVVHGVVVLGRRHGFAALERSPALFQVEIETRTLSRAEAGNELQLVAVVGVHVGLVDVDAVERDVSYEGTRVMAEQQRGGYVLLHGVELQGEDVVLLRDRVLVHHGGELRHRIDDPSAQCNGLSRLNL
mmetsp:Transcript_28496/g.55399  ORF Transcript_28496/g.55399 Transcript_28496/m.55399 type:complete len:259 (-) Transcript_28496:10-786(-)